MAPPGLAAQPNCQLDPNPPPAQPRVVHAELEGVEYNVLLPPDYATSGRRYPVLYLLHARNYSANSWLARSDVEELTAATPDNRVPIVVMPDGGPDGFHLDYFDGSLLWEQFHIGRLIDHIDRTYRTTAGGRHRAIAGMSIGGHGAMHYAARHPDKFAAAASFSGVVHLTIPDEPYAGPEIVETKTDAGSPGPARGPSDPPDYTPPRPTCQTGDALGNRTSDAWHWHAHNPTDLAPNLRGMGVYFMAGNGQPCGPEDANDPVIAIGAEPAALEDARYFDRALTAANVPHTFDAQPCGLHNMVTATRGLHAFWDLMLRSFGGSSATSFDHRSMDRDFTIHGWTFRADLKRAPEFLEVQNARTSGFTLIGSGTATVVTPPLFKPGQEVEVTGALPRIARASNGGRITLAVDLGAPAPGAQNSSGPRPFAARQVRFEPLPVRGSIEVAAAILPATRDCTGSRPLVIRMSKLRLKERRLSVAVYVGTRRVFLRRGRLTHRTKRVTIGNLPRTAMTVGIRIRTSQRRILRSSRAYAACD